MLTCPMCKKTLPESTQQCPRCSTDLSLLTDYVEHLHDGLARAETLTRQGELGEAVWAYLEVLEVDPDNASARRQIGRVATAVRQFDRAASSRRWLPTGTAQRVRRGIWLSIALSTCLIVAFLLGFYFGHQAARPTNSGETEAETVGIER